METVKITSQGEEINLSSDEANALADAIIENRVIADPAPAPFKSWAEAIAHNFGDVKNH